jgi:hypothetical protein
MRANIWGHLNRCTFDVFQPSEILVPSQKNSRGACANGRRMNSSKSVFCDRFYAMACAMVKPERRLIITEQLELVGN